MSNRRIGVCALLCSCFAPSLAQGGTVYYSVSPLPGLPGDFRYTYYLSGFDLAQYEELDFEFPAALYLSLSNAMTSPNVTSRIFQPNVPIGAAGDFTAEADVDLANVTGPWSIDFAYLGSGTPGPQTYFDEQFDSNGFLVGNPIQAEDIPVPEPGTMAVSGFALGVWAVRAALRRSAAPPVFRNL